MFPTLKRLQIQTRRHFLQQGAFSLGGVALATLLNQGRTTARDSTDNPLAPKKPPLPAKAKSVIYLHMSGAPPQHDLFDFKPKLKELHLKPCPPSLLQGQRFAFSKGTPLLLGPGSIHVAHTPDEHVSVAELRDAVGHYERLVRSLLVA